MVPTEQIERYAISIGELIFTILKFQNFFENSY